MVPGALAREAAERCTRPPSPPRRPTPPGGDARRRSLAPHPASPATFWGWGPGEPHPGRLGPRPRAPRAGRQHRTALAPTPSHGCASASARTPWSEQAEIMRAVAHNPLVTVQSCHGIGKNPPAQPAGPVVPRHTPDRPDHGRHHRPHQPPGPRRRARCRRTSATRTFTPNPERATMSGHSSHRKGLATLHRGFAPDHFTRRGCADCGIRSRGVGVLALGLVHGWTKEWGFMAGRAATAMNGSVWVGKMKSSAKRFSTSSEAFADAAPRVARCGA